MVKMLTSAMLLLFLHAACSSAQSCTAASCMFSHSAPDGKTALFDFSSVCKQAVAGEFNPNITGFPYSLQICGGFESPVYCNPRDWVPAFSHGVVVDQWDATVSIADNDANNCTEGCSGEGCCTAPCEVLAVGLPVWSVVDSANPSTGGVYASFAMVPRSAPTVTECKNGQFVVFQFNCDWTANVAVLNSVQLRSDTSDTCTFLFTFTTVHACFQPMISYGWIFIALLMAAVSSYVMLGMLVLIVAERKCDYPHRKQWTAFFEDVSLGRRWLWVHVKRAGDNSHVLHPE